MAQEEGIISGLGVPAFVVGGRDDLCRLEAGPAQIQAHAGGSNYSLMGG